LGGSSKPGSVQRETTANFPHVARDIGIDPLDTVSEGLKLLSVAPAAVHSPSLRHRSSPGKVPIVKAKGRVMLEPVHQRAKMM